METIKLLYYTPIMENQMEKNMEDEMEPIFWFREFAPPNVENQMENATRTEAM